MVGEAGAGKSRLVDEFLRGARESVPEAGVHIGRCLAYGDGLTYWPLRELLWAAAGILLQDSAAAAGEKLRRLVERVSAEPERTVSALAVTAGIYLPGNPLERLEPESVAAEVGARLAAARHRPRRPRRRASWWSRTCTGRSRRCSTCSSSSSRARPGRCWSSSPRGPSCSRPAPAGAGGARRRSSRSSR